MPPGNGVITPGVSGRRVGPRSAASSAASTSAPMNHRLPPIKPSRNPNRRSSDKLAAQDRHDPHAAVER